MRDNSVYLPLSRIPCGDKASVSCSRPSPTPMTGEGQVRNADQTLLIKVNE